MIYRVIGYAVVLAGCAFLLDWLEYRYMMRAFSTEIFIVVIALLFTAFGAWTAWKLTPAVSATDHKPQPDCATVANLGLTEREREVLGLLAKGQTNKEIARDLGLAPDTVKSHLSNLYRKLDVRRRTQAIRRARQLFLVD